MIASVISYAARLSLAPARLASHIAGSIVRELRGDRTPRAKPANRTGANAQPRRATTAARAKAQPRRATTGGRAKAQPRRATTAARAKAQPRRATTQARAKAQPKRETTQ